MENQRDIEYLKQLIKVPSSDMVITPDTRHNLTYNSIKPHLTNGILYEPEYFPYALYHKNTKRQLDIRKVYPPIENELDYQKLSNNTYFKRISKSSLSHRFRKTIDVFGEELSMYRFKQTNATDSIEQLPMIKLMMIAHMTFDYLEHRILIDDEDEFEPRIEFRFWFLDEITNIYSKEVIVSVDIAILFGQNNQPIIGDSTKPKYSTLAMFGLEEQLKIDNDESIFVIRNMNLTKVHIFHLLIKAFILITNILNIDLLKSNINSYIGTIRGGKIYRLEPRYGFDPNKLELNLLDVKYQLNKNLDKPTDPDLARSIWVTDNILEVFSSIKNNSNSSLISKPMTKRLSNKITKRKPTIAEFAEQNRVIGIEKLCQKRIPIPYSPYAIMIKNIFESDVLLGITAGNTFLYIIDSLEVDDDGDLRTNFLNPIRGNTISVDLYTILYNLQRIGLILDRNILNQLSTVKFQS